MKDFFKNSGKHLIGMIVLVILVGIFIHYHINVKEVKVWVYLLSMFAIANILGFFVGYGVEVVQRTFGIGTASKQDMYAAMIGANIGFIFIVLWVLL